ncbi:MAG: Ig-like domain-containing protein, partial [Planctomycetota bacterium]
LSASDPGRDRVIRWQVDWNDGSASSGETIEVPDGANEVTTNHTFTEADSDLIIRVLAEDEDGVHIEEKLIAVVGGLPAPAAVADGEANAFEGEPYTLTLAVSDAAVYGWSIDWGDGQTQVFDGPIAQATHRYADEALAPTIRATARTDAGLVAAPPRAVTVFNRPPTAADDLYAVRPGRPLALGPDRGVLANDFDASEDDVLTVTLQTPPTHGTLTAPLRGDGSFTYVPDTGFRGQDTFVYALSDGTDTAVGTVRVEVTAEVTRPLIHLPFDSITGVNGTTPNLGGGGDPAVVGAVLTDGVLGSAMTFGGPATRVDIPDAARLAATDEFTVAAWIDINETVGDSGGDSSGNNYRYMRIVSTKVFWESENGFDLEYYPFHKRLTLTGVGGEQFVAFDVDLSGGWHHVAATVHAPASPATGITPRQQVTFY